MKPNLAGVEDLLAGVEVKEPKKTTKRRGKSSIQAILGPKLLTQDPYETVGLEVHILRTTCSRCNSTFEAPLAGANAARRKVKRRETQAPSERIIRGPVPWVSTSEPQSVNDMSDWRHEGSAVAKALKEGKAAEIVLHETSCDACPRCTNIVTDSTNYNQMSLGLWPFTSKKPLAISPFTPEPKRLNTYRDQKTHRSKEAKSRLFHEYQNSFKARMLEAYDPFDPEAGDAR